MNISGVGNLARTTLARFVPQGPKAGTGEVSQATETVQLSSGAHLPPVNGKALALTGLAVGMALSGALTGCMPQPGIESPDITVNISRTYRNEDNFESVGNNSISVNCDLLQAEAVAGKPSGDRYQDPVSRPIGVAACPIATIQHRDSNRTSEELSLIGSNGQSLLFISQNELKSGFPGLGYKSEETEVATFRQSTPLFRISELEQNGIAGAAPRDEENGHLYQNGQEQWAFNTRENVLWGRGEGRLQGHDIAVADGQGELKLNADHGWLGGWGKNWLGSQVKTNAGDNYRVDSLKGNVGRSFFRGYSLSGNDGSQIGSLNVNTDLNRGQDAYTFNNAQGQELGTIYREDTSSNEQRCSGSGENRSCITLWKNERVAYHIRLAGDTPQAKLSNLESMDQMMALMPGQVNQDPHHLHDMEEVADMARFALKHGNATQVTPEIQRDAVAVATEEDPLTLKQALEMVR